MKIIDIMTSSPSWCIARDSSVETARITQGKNVGIILVVDSSPRHRLLGVLTDQNLCLEVVAANWQPSRVRVEECMSPCIVACHPEDEV